jgi:hypothetical protein
VLGQVDGELGEHAVYAVIRRAEDGSYQPRRRPCEVTTDGEVICDRLYVGASDDHGRRFALDLAVADLVARRAICRRTRASPSSPRAGDRRRRRRGPE